MIDFSPSPELQLPEQAGQDDNTESLIVSFNDLLDQLERQILDIREELSHSLKNQQEIQSKLDAASEESDLQLLQFHQVQEELEFYFLENQRISKDCQLKGEKLNWSRSQRELLMQLLEQQSHLHRRLFSVESRIMLTAALCRPSPWWRRFRRSCRAILLR